jgi:hypothetical protein
VDTAPPRISIVDVGLVRIKIPSEAGSRSKAWAKANWPPEAPLECIIEAIRQEARQEVLLAVERAITKEF